MALTILELVVAGAILFAGWYAFITWRTYRHARRLLEEYAVWRRLRMIEEWHTEQVSSPIATCSWCGAELLIGPHQLGVLQHHADGSHTVGPRYVDALNTDLAGDETSPPR